MTSNGDFFLVTDRPWGQQSRGFDIHPTADPFLVSGLSESGNELPGLRNAGVSGELHVDDPSLGVNFGDGRWHLSRRTLIGQQPGLAYLRANPSNYQDMLPLGRKTSIRDRQIYEWLAHAWPYLPEEDENKYAIIGAFMTGLTQPEIMETYVNRMLQKVENIYRGRDGRTFRDSLKVLPYDEANIIQERRKERIIKHEPAVLDLSVAPPLSASNAYFGGAIDIMGPLNALAYTIEGGNSQRVYADELGRVMKPRARLYAMTEGPIDEDLLRRNFDVESERDGLNQRYTLTRLREKRQKRH